MNKFRSLLKPKYVITGLLVAVGLAIGTGAALNAAARSCTNNDIIRCGTLSTGETVSHIKQNKTGDLPAIYNAYGLQAADYDRFVQKGKLGTAYKNGNIVVDGQTVATNAFSIGRLKKTHDVPLNIAGKTYYGAYSTQVFASNSIPVLVLFDDNGVMEFAVLTACGNPITGNKTKPSYDCKALNAPKTGTNTYSFSTNAPVSGGAKVSKVVYNFGDGTPEVTKTNPAEVVPHTYTKAGNFTAKVTVHVTLPGGATKVVAKVQCTKPIKVEEEKKPFYECKNLALIAINQANRQYRFTATTNQGNGATLKNADFNFGDGTTANDVTPASANTVVTDHTFAKAGNYTITADVAFNVGSDTKNSKCVVPLKIEEEKPPFYECKNLTYSVINKTQYTFTVTTNQGNGATFTKADFSFGDGTSQNGVTPATANTATASHTYTPGEYTINAKVYFTVGQDTKNANCTAKIKIEEEKKPFFACKNLVVTTIDAKEREYSFTVTTEQRDGPVFNRADFTFGDGQDVTNVTPATATTATTTHKYAKTLEGEVTISAKVYSTNGNDLNNAKCVVKLNFEKQPPKECKPGIPVGDERCEEVKECKPGIPVGDDRCKDCKTNPEMEKCQPVEIPSTGPAEVIGATVGLGSIAAAGAYYVGSRRNLLGSLLDR